MAYVGVQYDEKKGQIEKGVARYKKERKGNVIAERKTT